MVNPIYQQDEELLLNPFGSRYLSSDTGAYTDVNSNEFIVQEDTVISVLTGGDASISENSIDYKTSMNLSGVTLKKGALIVAPVGEAFKSITIDSGSIMAYNCVVKGEKPGSFVGLLDDYPDAAAAYSLRKLRTDYEGPAIQVRVDIPGTDPYDIGFDSNGELDVADLLSKAAGNDVFVAKRYDQSGNGYDLEQYTASKQPKIVNAGSLYTFNGKPYYLNDGIDDRLVSSTNPIFGADSRSLFFVTKANSIGVMGIFQLSNNTTDAQGWGVTPEVATRANVKVWVSSTAASTVSPSLISNIYTSGNLYAGNSMWLDGVSITRTSGTDGAINTKNNEMVEGAFYDRDPSSLSFDGYISESIIYKSDQSTNRAGIETNINNYYSIYE